MQKSKKIVSRKSYFWNPATCSCENARYTGSITDDSLIACDEVTETTKSILTKTIPTKSIPTNFNEKKGIYKLKMFCILLAFMLITMTLLIAVNIYFFIKYGAKQKHLLPFHDDNKRICIEYIQ